MDELRKTVALVLAIIAASLLAGGLLVPGISLEFEAHSNVTTGHVAEIVDQLRVRNGSRRTVHAERLEFADARGAAHSYVSSDTSTGVPRTVGQARRVRYRRDRPEDAVEETIRGSYAGGLLLVLALGFGVWALYVRRRPA